MNYKVILFMVPMMIIISGCSSIQQEPTTPIEWTFCTAYAPGEKAGMEPGTYWGYAYASDGTNWYKVEAVNLKDNQEETKHGEFRLLFYSLIDKYFNVKNLESIPQAKSVEASELQFKHCSSAATVEDVKGYFTGQLT